MKENQNISKFLLDVKKTISEIGQVVQNLVIVLVFLWFLISIIIYCKHYVFGIEDFPDFSMEDLLTLGFHVGVWFMFLIFIPLGCYLFAVMYSKFTKQDGDKTTDNKTSKCKYLAMIKSNITIVFNSTPYIVTLILAIMYILLSAYLAYESKDKQMWYALLLCLAYSVLFIFFHRGWMSIFITILIIISYFVFTYINIMGRAGIGNYYANIIVETTSFDRVYLNQKGIKVQDVNICKQDEKDKKIQEEKQSIAGNNSKENIVKKGKDVYYVDKNIIRFNNIKVLSSIGKKTFLECKVNDEAIKLNFDSSKVKFINKRNIPMDK